MFETTKQKLGEVTERFTEDNKGAVSISNMVTKVVAIAVGATVVGSVGITAVDSVASINTSAYSPGVAGMIELLPILVVVAFVFLFLAAAGLRNRV